MATRKEVIEPTLDQFFLVGNQGILDLTSMSPENAAQLIGTWGLPQTHSFSSLHNRQTVITDPDREIFYTRHGVARMIVDEPARATWKEGFTHPDKKIAEEIDSLWPVIEEAVERGDVWNRLYGGGFVVQGYNDGRPLSAPLGKASDITWAHAFSRKHVEKIEYDRVRGSPTYGLPVIYRLRTSRPGANEGTGGETVAVHADRILPLVERPSVNPLFGGSWLDPSWNDLEDIASLVWANAEAYHANASPKLALKTQRPLTKEQSAEFNRNLTKVRSGVRDVLKMLTTMELVPLNGQNQIPPPLEHVITSYVSLSLATGMPFSWFYQVHITSGEGLDWAARQKYEFIAERQATFGKRVARHWLTRNLAKAGMIDAKAARRAVTWNPPRTQTREDISKNVRNEAIAYASAVKAGGVIPKDLADRFVAAPPEVIAFMEKLATLGKPAASDGEGPKAQGEQKSGASTKNQSRGKPGGRS